MTSVMPAIIIYGNSQQVSNNYMRHTRLFLCLDRSQRKAGEKLLIDKVFWFIGRCENPVWSCSQIVCPGFWQLSLDTQQGTTQWYLDLQAKMNTYVFTKVDLSCQHIYSSPCRKCPLLGGFCVCTAKPVTILKILENGGTSAVQICYTFEFLYLMLILFLLNL